VRVVLTLLLWLLTTIALALAVPAAWAQRTIVDVDGYTAFARSAAHDPQLQDAMASELTAQVVAIARNRGRTVDASRVRAIATTYTASSSFPGQFALANRTGHQWLFTNTVQQYGNEWVIDLAPMLSDSSFRETLKGFAIELPSTVAVPVTATGGLRPGQLRPLATWSPLVSIGVAVLTAILALLTLAAARRRGRTIAALGISALLVGAGGWAALELARGRIDEALNRTTGDVHTIAELMVAHAETSLHQWLNLTLAAGSALVVLGVIASMLGALWRKA
jgi:hypothetical protein